DFFILPTNFCAAQILSNLTTTVTATTNLPTITTNVVTTNGPIVFTPGSVVFATNHTVVYLPVTCTPDTSERREGVEKIRFELGEYDSVLNQFDIPFTNNYTLIAQIFTNGAWIEVPQFFQRVVTAPDFLFSAADLAVGPAGNNFNGTV